MISIVNFVVVGVSSIPKRAGNSRQRAASQLLLCSGAAADSATASDGDDDDVVPKSATFWVNLGHSSTAAELVQPDLCYIWSSCRKSTCTKELVTIDGNEVCIVRNCSRSSVICKWQFRSIHCREYNSTTIVSVVHLLLVPLYEV